MLSCKIIESPIEYGIFQEEMPDSYSSGAFCTFFGVVRNFNYNKEVTSIMYEAYEELAKKETLVICEEASERNQLEAAVVIHRIGMVYVGEPAIAIGVKSPHRKEAFAGCQHIIDQIKIRVPIWKKEHYRDQSTSWVRCRHGEHSNGRDVLNPIP